MKNLLLGFAIAALAASAQPIVAQEAASSAGIPVHMKLDVRGGELC